MMFIEVENLEFSVGHIEIMLYIEMRKLTGDNIEIMLFVEM